MSNLLAQRRILPNRDPLYGFVDTHFLPALGRSGQTSFVENSPNRRVVSLSGGASLSDTVQLGPGPSLSNLSAGYVQIPTSRPLATNTEPFCMEGWFYNTLSDTSQKFLLAITESSTNASPFLGWNAGSFTIWGAGYPGTAIGISQNSYLNQWVHVALARESNRVRVYFNGNLVSSRTDCPLDLGLTATTFSAFSHKLGMASGGSFGYCGEARLTIGHPRYTENFVPKITSTGGVYTLPVPQTIPGLALWLDASDAGSITLDGSNNVSRWRDKSGNGRHAAQGSAANRPAYSLNAVNGLNAITLDGTNDVMAGPQLIASDGNYTMFGVVRKLTNTSLAYFTSGPCGLAIGVNGYSDRPGFLVADVTFVYEANPLSANTTICQSVRRQSGVFSYKRGASSLSSSLTPTNYSAGYIIGTHAGGYFQNQIICELLYYSTALSDSQITQIETYLTQKWGIT